MLETPEKWTNYTAFGSTMPGRNFTSSSYRYGFNGKENDNETSTQDYGMRIYNPNLGKFLSVDPLTKSYPMLTPYQFASNTPIMAIDLDGEEQFTVIRPTSNARPIMTNRPGNGGYPRGRSAGRGRGSWTAPHIGDNVETNLTIDGHTNYKFVDQNVWFDANGHPQTDVVETPILKPMEDPMAKKLQNNLNESKLAEANKEDDKYIYRAMGVGADGKPEIPFDPNISPDKIPGRMLGVRSQDIADLLNPDGTVSPGVGKGGMSTAPTPFFRDHIEGDILKGKRIVFKILKTDLQNMGFILDRDDINHISVQPGTTMSVEKFQEKIISTKDKWIPK